MESMEVDFFDCHLFAADLYSEGRQDKARRVCWICVYVVAI